VIRRETEALEARVDRLRRGAAPPTVAARTVILVDDGVATGGTMRAAIQAMRKGDAARIVVAVPVAAPETLQVLRREADEVVCLHAPSSFQAVGNWYEDFRQVHDHDVARILDDHRSWSGGAVAGSPPA
jgi:putative phosphoribosyl transferase